MGSGKTFSNDPVDQHLPGLEEADSYECPMCRHGQIEQMALMDAYACSFCRHIFDLNLAGQTVQVVDGLQPMGWRWQGRRWQPIYQGSGSEVALTLWLVGGVLVIFPAGLVALGGYMFPPLVENAGINWSVAWAIGTLAAHSTMVGWLMAEHYQLPIYVLAKIRLQRFLARLPA